jgi:hypothetical protein
MTIPETILDITVSDISSLVVGLVEMPGWLGRSDYSRKGGWTIIRFSSTM